MKNIIVTMVFILLFSIFTYGQNKENFTLVYKNKAADFYANRIDIKKTNEGVEFFGLIKHKNTDYDLTQFLITSCDDGTIRYLQSEGEINGEHYKYTHPENEIHVVSSTGRISILAYALIYVCHNKTIYDKELESKQNEN